jgi:hypothetical protein
MEHDQGAPLKMSEDWTTNVEVFLYGLLISFHESVAFKFIIRLVINYY